MITPPTLCQRWRDHRSSYRPAGEPIDPSQYGVEVIDEKTARSFVVGHHYSASYPAARCRVGLFQGVALVGVAVFSVPAGPSVLSRWCGVDDSRSAVELGRFVLLDHVPANGETWFLARAYAALVGELPEVGAVLAFSDPTPRKTASGEIIKPGHVGTIYKAHNGRFVGTSTARTIYLDGEGRVLSGRALSKLRAGTKGAGYAAELLERSGAPRRMVGESGASWVQRALKSGCLRRVRHPGNLAYVWTVGDKRQRRIAGRGLPPAMRAHQADLFGGVQ